MDKKNIILLYGGGGHENEISKISMNHIVDLFKDNTEYNLIEIYTDSKLEFYHNKEKVQLQSFDIYSIIPCFHGTPGETGEIQPQLEKLGMSYIGCKEIASKNCFDKSLTKKRLEKIGISTTPYLLIKTKSEMLKATEFFTKFGSVFVKANSQGSSVGCYPVEFLSDLEESINKAFGFSDSVLLEKFLNPRELEISAYEFEGKLHISYPSEIIKGKKFYSFDEKYSEASKTKTDTRAKHLTNEQVELIQNSSRRAFKELNLRHLSRIDFFLDQGNIYLNEINTFPGLTPISMFPKMLESNGHSFYNFLKDSIESSVILGS